MAAAADAGLPYASYLCTTRHVLNAQAAADRKREWLSSQRDWRADGGTSWPTGSRDYPYRRPGRRVPAGSGRLGVLAVAGQNPGPGAPPPPPPPPRPAGIPSRARRPPQRGGRDTVDPPPL